VASRRLSNYLGPPVLAQAWRGGPQPSLAWLLSGCRVEDMDERRARAAGALCGAARTADVVDATVVAGAVARGGAVLTSDPRDLSQLARALDARLEIHQV
jgi:hypothetical protein